MASPNGQGGYPRLFLNKGDRSFCLVDFTPVPYCRGTRLGTCRLSSRLQGVGRPLSARPCPWPELAADSVRVSFPRLPGKHLPPRGSTTRSCIPRHRDSGVSAGCEIAATRAYASPCLVRIMPSAPFEIAVERLRQGEASAVRWFTAVNMHARRASLDPRYSAPAQAMTWNGTFASAHQAVWLAERLLMPGIPRVDGPAKPPTPRKRNRTARRLQAPQQREVGNERVEGADDSLGLSAPVVSGARSCLAYYPAVQHSSVGSHGREPAPCRTHTLIWPPPAHRPEFPARVPSCGHGCRSLGSRKFEKAATA